MIQFLKDWMMASGAIVVFVCAVSAMAMVIGLVFAGLWKLLGVAGAVLGIILLFGFLFTIGEER